MSYRKELLTAAGTLTCALGIGFIMQSGDAARERYGVMESSENEAIFLPPPAKPAVVDASMEASLGPIAILRVQDITLTSATVEPVDIALVSESPISAPRSPSSDLVTPHLPESAVSEAPSTGACGLGLTATPVDAAMVELTFVAPCNPGAAVTFSHAGLAFDARTDGDGKLVLEVPALAELAQFDAHIANGKSMSVTTEVPDLDQYDRIVLVSAAGNGLHLHAREFGADYGQLGHVWAGSEGRTDGNGGFLAILGETGSALGQRVEAYTIKRALEADGEGVAITVETEISAQNCGREVKARVLSRDVEGKSVATDLALSVPGCDAAGGYLVLNYPPRDLTVAAR